MLCACISSQHGTRDRYEDTTVLLPYIIHRCVYGARCAQILPKPPNPCRAAAGYNLDPLLYTPTIAGYSLAPDVGAPNLKHILRSTYLWLLYWLLSETGLAGGCLLLAHRIFLSHTPRVHRRNCHHCTGGFLCVS